MNVSRLSSVSVLSACVVSACAVTLVGCGSQDTKPAAGATSSTVSIDSALPNAITPVSTDVPTAPSCPTAAATGGADWKLNGTTGSVAVTGPTDTSAPAVTVSGPFSVTETQVHTLHAGDGPVISPTATVLVCYAGFDGRDGHKFDSAFDRGEPAQFPLTGVVPGFQKAIAGQKVGSTVAVAMAPADGYPDGQPSAGIGPGESLIFAIKILDAAG